MPYDPKLVQPMREELTRLGAAELMTAAAVEEFLTQTGQDTGLLVVNSVCGCAAGGARPAISLAMQHENRPTHLGTVFAGQDVEATQRAREAFVGIPPSSPCFALFKNGKVVHFVPRHHIEGRDAQAIAFDLMSAFDQHCATASGSPKA